MLFCSPLLIQSKSSLLLPNIVSSTQVSHGVPADLLWWWRTATWTTQQQQTAQRYDPRWHLSTWRERKGIEPELWRTMTTTKTGKKNKKKPHHVVVVPLALCSKMLCKNGGGGGIYCRRRPNGAVTIGVRISLLSFPSPFFLNLIKIFKKAHCKFSFSQLLLTCSEVTTHRLLPFPIIFSTAHTN